MLKSDKLELERGAAAKTENQARYNGKENRRHDRDGTASSRKSPASLSPVEILSKDRYSACPAPISASMFSRWRRRRAIPRNSQRAWNRGSIRSITA